GTIFRLYDYITRSNRCYRYIERRRKGPVHVAYHRGYGTSIEGEHNRLSTGEPSSLNVHWRARSAGGWTDENSPGNLVDNIDSDKVACLANGSDSDLFLK